MNEGLELRREDHVDEEKGQAEEMRAWADYLSGRGEDVAGFEIAALSTWLTLRAVEASETGGTLDVAGSLPEILGS